MVAHGTLCSSADCAHDCRYEVAVRLRHQAHAESRLQSPGCKMTTRSAQHHGNAAIMTILT